MLVVNQDPDENNDNASSCSSSSSIHRRYKMTATTAWALACVGLSIICGPLVMGMGIARGWNTAFGQYSFQTIQDAKRFWPEPNEHAENADLDSQIAGRNFPGASGTWYYWKYRPSSTDECQVDRNDGGFDQILSCQVPQATAYTRCVVWLLYVLHQCIIWALIYKAQREHEGDVQYHSELRWYNVWSLVVNLIFYLLHLVQTHVTYDALAQDVTEASSQGSVIMLLVMVLVMEYKHRGLFLGWPSSSSSDATTSRQGRRCCSSWKLPTRPIELVRKYHGYAFAWATIFTLWYHPMESTVGHLLGFLHTGFLLIQQSLMYTPIHLNKYWKLLLEAWVAIHGGVVALQVVQTGKSPMWGMFAFGFLWMFVFTQIHGIPYYLGFVQQVSTASPTTTTNNDKENSIIQYVPTKKWQRIIMRLLPVIIYFSIVLVCYATVLSKKGEGLSFQSLAEIIRIPSILYLLVFFTIFVGWGMLRFSDIWSGGSNVVVDKDTSDNSDNIEVPSSPTSVAEERTDHLIEDHLFSSSKLRTGSMLIGFTICYGLMVSVSVLIEQFHLQLPLFILMVMLAIIFTFLSLLAMILMDKNMNRTALGSPKVQQNVVTKKCERGEQDQMQIEDGDFECPSIVVPSSSL